MYELQFSGIRMEFANIPIAADVMRWLYEHKVLTPQLGYDLWGKERGRSWRFLYPYEMVFADYELLAKPALHCAECGAGYHSEGAPHDGLAAYPITWEIRDNRFKADDARHEAKYGRMVPIPWTATRR